MSEENTPPRRPSPPSRPLAERGDDIEAPQVQTPAPHSPSPDMLGDAVETQHANAQQQKRDASVEDHYLPGQEASPPVVIAGMDLDEVSLTTITFLKKANSKLIQGKKPTTQDATLWEIGLFFLAHSTDIPIRERSKMFRSKKKDLLEEEVDVLMHGVKLTNADRVFAAIVDRLERQTRTLVLPADDKDGDDGEPVKKT